MYHSAYMVFLKQPVGFSLTCRGHRVIKDTKVEEMDHEGYQRFEIAGPIYKNSLTIKYQVKYKRLMGISSQSPFEL